MVPFFGRPVRDSDKIGPSDRADCVEIISIIRVILFSIRSVSGIAPQHRHNFMQRVQSIHYFLLGCKEGKAESQCGFQQRALHSYGL